MCPPCCGEQSPREGTKRKCLTEQVQRGGRSSERLRLSTVHSGQEERVHQLSSFVSQVPLEGSQLPTLVDLLWVGQCLVPLVPQGARAVATAGVRIAGKVETTTVSKTMRIMAKPTLAGKQGRCVGHGKVYKVSLIYLPSR